jgi:flagellar biosynthesis GTPase FlhF
MRAIFISYRREDAEGQAGRLFDDLTKHFGEKAVFMDVAGIAAGRDFRKAIEEHVTSCGVLLAMIGKSWLDAKNESGQRRLEDPADFVRLETASALKRDIPVVPVLVQGARMPRKEQLPEDIAELAFRNGVELTHARWDSDVEVLIKALSPYMESAAKLPQPAGAVSQPTGEGTKTTAPKAGMIAAAVTAIVIAVGGYLWYESSSRTAEQQRLAEQKRKQDEIAENQRLAEEKRKQDALAARQRLAEEKRKQDELAEKRRLAEEKSKQDELAEKQRLAEEKRRQQARAEALRTCGRVFAANRQYEISLLTEKEGFKKFGSLSTFGEPAEQSEKLTYKAVFIMAEGPTERVNSLVTLSGSNVDIFLIDKSKSGLFFTGVCTGQDSVQLQSPAMQARQAKLGIRVDFVFRLRPMR